MSKKPKKKDCTIEITESLSHDVEELTKEVHKQNSGIHIFINGIISGLGRTLGATIVFAITIALLSYVIKVSNAQWVDTLVTWLGLNTYIN